MEDGTKIFVKEDSLLTIYDWKYEIKDRKEPLKESPKDSIETYKSNDISSVWYMAQFNEENKNYGIIKNGRYYTRIEDYIIEIPCRSNEIPVPYIPTPSSIGLKNPTNKKIRGYSFIPAYNIGGKYIAHTYLWYVGYDSNGKFIGKYYPCKPEELKWYYSLLKI